MSLTKIFLSLDPVYIIFLSLKAIADTLLLCYIISRTNELVYMSYNLILPFENPTETID